jgi:hypothetical protein
VPDLKILFHDNCFDGATSAALFAEFYLREQRPGADIELRGVQHKIGDPFAGVALDGRDNACVDFRYCPDLRMTWWFDHHVSAFQPAELREHFETHPSEQKVFDPDARSCAILIRRELERRFGFVPVDPDGIWAELVEWADKIDGAQFASAREAVELEAPALRISAWLEHNDDSALSDRLIRTLGRRPLAEIAAEPWIAGALEPILETHRASVELIRERARVEVDVVSYDLAGDGVWAPNKFIAYMLFPDARYTVGVSRGGGRAKVSVGSNPWAPNPRTHDIAAICERYGGGGHAVVGAVSMPEAELERIREIAGEIAAELGG